MAKSFGYSTEVESRTQGSWPRTQKKSEAKAKDSLSEDRHSRGQGQECSRPRTKDTSASALQKQKQVLTKNFQAIKKKVFTKIFRAISTKKQFPKNFSSAPRNFNNSKNSAVLEPRTGQFSRTWGLKAKDLTFEAKAKDFKMCRRGRPRGQGRPLVFNSKFIPSFIFVHEVIAHPVCAYRIMSIRIGGIWYLYCICTVLFKNKNWKTKFDWGGSSKNTFGSKKFWLELRVA